MLQIYKSFEAPKKPCMSFRDGVNLFSRDAVFLLEKDAVFCCAMSKMLIRFELEGKCRRLGV